jgi:hypothetical protein
MDRHCRRSRRMALLLVLVTGSVALLSGTPEASAVAAEALNGRVFAVEATNCEGVPFTDTFCFTDNTMTVETLHCGQGPLLESEPQFAGFVRRVLFLGTVQDGTISGSGLRGECLSTFTGSEISQCPCAAPAAEPAKENPYGP